MKDFKKIGLIYENMNSGVVGYHGSYGNQVFDKPNLKGIWFAEDQNSDIVEYYSSRGGLIKAELDLGNNLDLSMYNADEMMNDSYVESFLGDMGISEKDQNIWLNRLYFEDYETDYDDEGEPSISASEILNNIIEYVMIPQKLYDSVSINEGQDYMTHCILNKNNIQIIEKPEEEVVVEKSSSHAEGKEVVKLLKIAKKKGLVDAVETKSGYMVKSLVDNSQFLIHKGGKDFHPLRRYLNGLERAMA